MGEKMPDPTPSDNASAPRDTPSALVIPATVPTRLNYPRDAFDSIGEVLHGSQNKDESSDEETFVEKYRRGRRARDLLPQAVGSKKH